MLEDRFRVVVAVGPGACLLKEARVFIQMKLEVVGVVVKLPEVFVLAEMLKFVYEKIPGAVVAVEPVVCL